MEARILPRVTPWKVLEGATFVIFASAWFYSVIYLRLETAQVLLAFFLFAAFSFVLRAVFRRLEAKFPVELKLP